MAVNSNLRAADVKIVMKRIDREKGEFEMSVNREIEWHAIRSRVEMEMGIPPTEQILLFRAAQIDQEFQRQQPLNTPDLEDIVNEAGDEGLNMCVAWVPFRWPAFLEKEGFSDKNAKKKKTGATALHRAARLSELQVMEELLGLDDFKVADAKDKSGQTALHTALRCRNREACEIVLTAHPRYNPTPPFAAVNCKDFEGKTALHYAAFWGDEHICKLIVASGRLSAKDAEIKDELGNTALSYATECGHSECAEVIIEFIAARDRKLEAAVRALSQAAVDGLVTDAIVVKLEKDEEERLARLAEQESSDEEGSATQSAVTSPQNASQAEASSPQSRKEENTTVTDAGEQSPSKQKSGPLTGAVDKSYQQDKVLAKAQDRSRGIGK